VVNPLIFREYDIRGRVGEDLTPETVVFIGKGFGTYTMRGGGKSLMVGRDCRLSSPSFRDALVEGVLSTGMDVVDVGICPTPLLYFSILRFGADGGVMVTGSHNPPEFNGFKLCVGPVTLYGDRIREIRRIIESRDFVSGKGRESSRNVVPDYREYVASNISIPRRLKVVVDAGNGTAGPVAPPLFRELGVDVVELFCGMDGTFPNHFPDPTVPENLASLIRVVRETRADVGVAYDGDADRIGAVDDRGEILFGDSLLTLFAREILRRKPGATIISEVKASQNLYDDIARHGGKPLMWKAGHSLIKKKMREVSAEVAGEMSGHIFFTDRYLGFDDAIYASARLFEIIADSDRPLSEMLSDLPPVVSTPEIRVECPDEIKFRVAERVAEIIRPQARDVIELDGVRAVFDGGWGLVRASNTQPVLVLRFEGKDRETVERIRALMEKAVDTARAGIP
jgi:phosphomannomutase/phosphoglucomutase